MNSQHLIRVRSSFITEVHIQMPHIVISALKTERGLALQDLITGAYEYAETIEFKPHARIYLLDYLATTEYASHYSQSFSYPDIHLI